MRVIKLAIISIIFFSFLLTGISLFFPSHIRISKAINIGAPRDSILAAIRNPGRWTQWYPGGDSAQPLYINGEIKGLLFDHSDSIHPTRLLLEKVTAEEVTAEFSGSKQRTAINGWSTVTYPSTDSVTLQWYMDFHLGWYPWDKFASLLLEKNYSGRMEKGLANLKTILEK